MTRRVLYLIVVAAMVLGMALPMATPVVAGAISSGKVATQRPDQPVHPPGVYVVGQTIYYSLNVTNHSLSDQFVLKIADQIPIDRTTWGPIQGVTKMYWWNAVTEEWDETDPNTPVTIGPGDVWVGNFSYVISDGVLKHPEEDYLVFVNRFIASVNPEDTEASPGTSATRTVRVIAPEIELEKTVEPQQAEVGQNVTYTFTITNTGDWPLDRIFIEDDKLPDHELQAEIPDDLVLAEHGEEGDSYTFTYVYTIQAGELPLKNTATVWGTAEGFDPAIVGAVVSHFDTAEVTPESDPPVPGIQIEKHTNGEDADTPATAPYIPVGGAVTWTYYVENTGDVDLTGVLVTDDQLGVNPIYVSGDDGDDILNPGEVWVYEASGVAVAGQYANIGTATGTPPVGANVSDTDPSHYFGSGPGIDIQKHTNGVDADTPAAGPQIPVGGNVTWTYYVENTGNVDLTDILVTDNQPGVTPVYVSGDDGDGILNPGEIWVYQALGVAVAGQYANIGTATGTPPVGPNVSDTDPSHYFGSGPGIDIQKHTNGVDADTPAAGPQIPVGGNVTWTYYVENTGSVDLTGIVVTDNQPGVTPVYVSGDDGDGILNPGEIWVYQALGVAVAGQYANIGTATGTPPVGPDVSDTDPSHYFGRTDITVGWEGRSVNKVAVLAPWIALMLGAVACAVLFVRRRQATG